MTSPLCPINSSLKELELDALGAGALSLMRPSSAPGLGLALASASAVRKESQRYTIECRPYH